jgi:hypothetical protein
VVDRRSWSRIRREGQRQAQACLRLFRGEAQLAIGRKATQKRRGAADRRELCEASEAPAEINIRERLQCVTNVDKTTTSQSRAIPTEKERPDDAVLFDLLAEWAPDPASRTFILVQNPATLYGFPR